MIAKVEDAFGFAVSDDDTRELNTVGKLYDYILARRFHAKLQARLNNIALYRIRRALAKVLRRSREELRPSVPLSTLIPTSRYRVWRTIEKTTGLRLPQLRRPPWVCAAAILSTIVAAIAVPAWLSLGPFSGAVLMAVGTAFIAGHSAYWLTAPLAYQFQPDCTTVGQFAAATLARNYRPLVEESSKSLGDAEVWAILRSLAAEQLGVRPTDIAKQTSFGENLQAA
jgi:hypothetical protein